MTIPWSWIKRHRLKKKTVYKYIIILIKTILVVFLKLDLKVILKISQWKGRTKIILRIIVCQIFNFFIIIIIKVTWFGQ